MSATEHETFQVYDGLADSDKDRYLVSKERLGKGGFGVIYKGVDQATGQEVAYKWSHNPGKDAAMTLVHEALMANRAHTTAPDNTVRIHKVINGINPRVGGVLQQGKSSGAVMIMDECSYPTAFSLANLGVLTCHVEILNRFAISLFTALERIHASSVIHQDICLQNVLCGMMPDEMPESVVIDFSHARNKNGERDRGDGKISNRPPEFYHRHTVMPTGDIYSSAGAIYTAWARRQLHHFNKDEKINTQMAETTMTGFSPAGYSEYLRIKLLNLLGFGIWMNPENEAKVKRLKEVLTRCLAFDPADRYQRAQDVVDELRK